MKPLYIGNLNDPRNRRVQNGVVYYLRGTAQWEGVSYERYAVQTPLLDCGCDIAAAVAECVVPLYQLGDVLAVTEKIISLAEKRVVHRQEIHPGLFARIAGKHMLPHPYDRDERTELPNKLQLMVQEAGLLKTVWAAFVCAVGRVIGRRGDFYRILGHKSSGIDGLYKDSDFSFYRDHALLIPQHGEELMQTIARQTGIPCFISDTNDRDAYVYGFSWEEADAAQKYAALLGDNPGGQNDELTPFILIRKAGEASEPYVPMEEASPETFEKWQRDIHEKKRQYPS